MYYYTTVVLQEATNSWYLLQRPIPNVKNYETILLLVKDCVFPNEFFLTIIVKLPLSILDLEIICFKC